MKEFEVYVNRIVDETDLSDIEKGELFLELLQIITLAGVFDIDDIILNVTGALLGYGIWKVFRKFRIAKQTKNPVHT